MIKVLTAAFRVWFDEDSTPLALMLENGHDTLYMLKRATKADKDQLFDTQNTNEPQSTMGGSVL